MWKEIFAEMAVAIKSEKEISKWIQKSKMLKSIERIPGDASTRKYYRIKTGAGSFILMKCDPFKKDGENFLFLAVQKHMESCGARVPKVYDFDAASGFILLEDLGDITLLRRLQQVEKKDEEIHLYQRVIDELVKVHVHCGPKSDLHTTSLPAFDLRFDVEKLMWEVNFAVEHFYETHMKRKISRAHRETLNAEFGEICKRLADEPLTFCHRDFHSRNIMVTDADELVLIDFQDARMGPAQYDLASLLRDSYYQLDEDQVWHLVKYYFEAFNKKTSASGDWEHFKRIFDLMAIQRNFKAIGSFASFLNRRKNPSYLKYIGNTFENIRKTLMRHPEFSGLREVLFHYYYF